MHFSKSVFNALSNGVFEKIIQFIVQELQAAKLANRSLKGPKPQNCKIAYVNKQPPYVNKADLGYSGQINFIIDIF